MSENNFAESVKRNLIQYSNWIVSLTWGKFVIFAILLAVVSKIIFLHGLAGLVIIGSLGIKLLYKKDSSNTPT